MSGDVRGHVMDLWGVTQMGLLMYRGELGEGHGKLRDLLSLMAYAAEHPSRRRRTPMDVAAMVKAWVPIIVGLSTSHSKDELDRCEFEMDRHLTPMLAAPVRELREFFAALVGALEKDKRVPFFVHRMFMAYHEVIVKAAPDGAFRELKTKLAGEIADLVEKDVVPDIKDAIAGALAWRSPEQLEEVKAAVQKGAKPRLRGRESCLFLCVPKGDGTEAVVML